jgi:hypothetical protein
LIARLLADAAKETEHQKFIARFLLMEWEAIVDAWLIETWEAYRDVLRLGRKTKLPQKHQATLWSIFDRGRKELDARNLVTLRNWRRKSRRAPSRRSISGGRSSQDMAVAHICFFAAIGGNRPNGLFFAGDMGNAFFSSRSRGSRLGSMCADGRIHSHRRRNFWMICAADDVTETASMSLVARRGCSTARRLRLSFGAPTMTAQKSCFCLQRSVKSVQSVAASGSVTRVIYAPKITRACLGTSEWPRI